MINNLNNISFGKFFGYRQPKHLNLSKQEKIALAFLSNELNKCSDSVDVTGYIFNPRVNGGIKSLRIEIKPTSDLYEKIKVMSPPDTTFEDYTKISPWIPLNFEDLIERTTTLIKEQKEMYHKYTQIPNHTIKQPFYKDEFYGKFVD